MSETVKLRSVEDIRAAYELVFNRQLDGAIDNKVGNAMNRTLQGSAYVNGKLPLEAMKTIVQSAKLNLKVPKRLLEFYGIEEVQPEEQASSGVE